MTEAKLENIQSFYVVETEKFEVGKKYGYKSRMTKDFIVVTVQITRKNDKTVWFKIEGDDKEYHRKIRIDLFLETFNLNGLRITALDEVM